MFLGDILTITSKQKQRTHNKTTQNILKIIIAMGTGIAMGLAATLCCAKKSKGVGHMDLKKRSAETVESVMNAVENIQDSTESVKKDIKSGYEDFKHDTNEVAENISNLCDKTSENNNEPGNNSDDY